MGKKHCTLGLIAILFTFGMGPVPTAVPANAVTSANHDRVIFFDRDSDWVIGDLNDQYADPAYPNWPGGDPSGCSDANVAATGGYFIDTVSENFYWLANPVNSSSPVTIEKLTTDGVCSTAFTLENPSGYLHETYPISIDFDQQSRRAAAAVTSNVSGNHGVSGLDSYWNDKVGLLDIGAGTQRILELSVPADDGTFVPAGEDGPYWRNYIGFSEYVGYGDIEWLEFSDVSIFGNQLWVAGLVGNNNTANDYMDAVAKYDLSTMSTNGSLYVPTLERFVPINVSDTGWFSIAADDENVYLANWDSGYDPVANPTAISSSVYRIGEEDVEGTPASLEVVWGPTGDAEALGIDLGSSGNLYVFDSSGMWRSVRNPHGMGDFEQLVFLPKTDPADNREISLVYDYVAPIDGQFQPQSAICPDATPGKNETISLANKVKPYRVDNGNFFSLLSMIFEMIKISKTNSTSTATLVLKEWGCNDALIKISKPRNIQFIVGGVDLNAPVFGYIQTPNKKWQKLGKIKPGKDTAVFTETLNFKKNGRYIIHITQYPKDELASPSFGNKTARFVVELKQKKKK